MEHLAKHNNIQRGYHKKLKTLKIHESQTIKKAKTLK